MFNYILFKKIYLKILVQNMHQKLYSYTNSHLPSAFGRMLFLSVASFLAANSPHLEIWFHSKIALNAAEHYPVMPLITITCHYRIPIIIFSPQSPLTLDIHQLGSHSTAATECIACHSLNSQRNSWFLYAHSINAHDRKYERGAAQQPQSERERPQLLQT